MESNKSIDQVVRLKEWIQDIKEMNDAFKKLPAMIDEQLSEYQQITDNDKAVAAMVELLFIGNKLNHILDVWLGKNDEEDN